MILSSDKSSERNLSSFFDIKKPRRIEHLQSEEPFSSDPYFRGQIKKIKALYLTTIADPWYFWKGSCTSKAHKPVTLSGNATFTKV